MHRASAILLAFVVLGSERAPAADAVVSGAFTSDGVRRTYAAYVPAGERPRPLVILLHGSGGSGRAMVDRWKALAQREGFVVAGPDATDRSRWRPRRTARTSCATWSWSWNRDTSTARRIYLFGYSAGAVFALYMAPLESGYFAAAASHAGAYGGEADLGFLDAAPRKIPLLLSAGTKDDLFPPSAVTATASRLQRAGFP